jgi:hypothetical protein
MANMPLSNEERREFFRINDRTFIDFSEIEVDDIKRISHSIRSPKTSDKNSEKAQLDSIQTVFNHLTDTINQTDREVARALRMLDEKINLIAQNVRRQQSANNGRHPVDVNLSGGGIAFMTDQPYQPKDAFEINLELIPSGNLIHSIANVVACTKITGASSDKPYYLRLVFSHMNEYDRNLLVKHTLTRQAETLRASQVE